MNTQQRNYLEAAKTDLQSASRLVLDRTGQGRRLTLAETAEVLAKIRNAEVFVDLVGMVDGEA